MLLDFLIFIFHVSLVCFFISFLSVVVSSVSFTSFLSSVSSVLISFYYFIIFPQSLASRFCSLTFWRLLPYCIFFFFEIHWGNIYVKIFIWSVMSFLDSSSVICFSCFLLLFSSSIFVKSLCCLILNYSSLEEVSFSWTSY